MGNKLKVTSVENRSPFPQPLRKSARREEIQAIMERLWHQDPEQFDAERDQMQRVRLERTLALIKTLSLKNKRAVDLGCAAGVMTRKIRDEGANVDAVDVASQALKYLKEGDMHHIAAFQDCLPTTTLEDDKYDLVVCTEVIGYLAQNEYRMAFAELSRLVSAEGAVICSTALDMRSEDALERFAALTETEFTIDQWVFCYFRLQTQLAHFFEAPQRLIKASQDAQFRHSFLQGKRGISHWWLKVNLHCPFVWKAFNLVFAPTAYLFRQNRMLTRVLERICKFIWSQTGISHAIFLGKRRPLSFPLPPSEQPKEMKHKRQVWE